MKAISTSELESLLRNIPAECDNHIATKDNGTEIWLLDLRDKGAEYRVELRNSNGYVKLDIQNKWEVREFISEYLSKLSTQEAKMVTIRNEIVGFEISVSGLSAAQMGVIELLQLTGEYLVAKSLIEALIAGGARVKEYEFLRGGEVSARAIIEPIFKSNSRDMWIENEKKCVLLYNELDKLVKANGWVK